MIRNPGEIHDENKKIRMLIAGYPGIGKSTLALSAPKPLHIDLDFGIDRVEPRYRKPYIQPASYDEIRHDLAYDPTMTELDRAAAMKELDEFETLVFDTGGKLITLMSQWAINQNPKYGMRDGSLSLKGYGFVGREFVKLMDHCFYVLHKHIVIVFHAVEDKDGDNTRLRIKVEGQTKNNVWEPMDLGGFVTMVGNDRVIGFDNCESYFAKGTRGVHGVWKIPALTETSPNDFLEKVIFEKYKEASAAEIQRLNEEKKAYSEAMEIGRGILESCTDVDTLNSAIEGFNNIHHALTSKKELVELWKAKVDELNLRYNKETKLYEVK